MSVMKTTFHKKWKILSNVESVIEEIEAVDWYNQRATTTENSELKAIAEHNRDEEIECACMMLELIRRTELKWEKYMKEFLFTEGSITEIEES